MKNLNESALLAGMGLIVLEVLAEELPSKQSLAYDFFIFCNYTVDSCIACHQQCKFCNLT